MGQKVFLESNQVVVWASEKRSEWLEIRWRWSSRKRVQQTERGGQLFSLTDDSASESCCCCWKRPALESSSDWTDTQNTSQVAKPNNILILSHENLDNYSKKHTSEWGPLVDGSMRENETGEWFLRVLGEGWLRSSESEVCLRPDGLSGLDWAMFMTKTMENHSWTR